MKLFINEFSEPICNIVEINIPLFPKDIMRCYGKCKPQCLLLFFSNQHRDIVLSY